MKKRNFKKPVAIVMMAFTALQIAGVFTWSIWLFNFPKLSELVLVQGQILEQLTYRSYKGGGALTFTIQSSNGPVPGVINCHRNCAELKNLEGTSSNFAGAWFSSTNPTDKPNSVFQLESGGLTLWPYAKAAEESKSNYRSVLLAFLIATAIGLALVNVASKEEPSREPDL